MALEDHAGKAGVLFTQNACFSTNVKGAEREPLASVSAVCSSRRMQKKKRGIPPRPWGVSDRMCMCTSVCNVFKMETSSEKSSY